jgi:hypothetical protein
MLYKNDAARLSFNRMNVGPSYLGPRHADHSWNEVRWYDGPREDPAWPEVHTYTNAISYLPGEEVVFHSSTTASVWTLAIVRDGLHPVRVHLAANLPGHFTAAPKDAYSHGCGWPAAHRWRIPEDAPSGFYRVESTCARRDEGVFVQHHFFVVRPTERTTKGRLLHVLPTSTWMAYNDWGGANSYLGVSGPDANLASPELSLERPWTRGIVWLPDGAPRLCTSSQEPKAPPRYEVKEWAYANGFGFFYAASGWAQYDRHFAIWAEAEGYGFDTITQTDMHYHPEILDGYDCVVIVGHDEYWSRDMRVAIENYVEKGGKLARFGANFTWQIRLEEQGRKQVCYKHRAPAEDPVRDTPDAHLLSTAWEDHRVAWPGSSTVGVNGLGGVYASWGGFVPRGSRGFTLYRPEHWVFADTDLTYGDVFGAEARIFAYEVDGVDYTFRDGLPYPTGADGTPAEVEILAMSPAVLAEGEYNGFGYRHYIGSHDQYSKADMVHGAQTPEVLAKSKYGAGMLIAMKRGRGEVVTAATCEWVMGLKRGCLYTQQITRNVLDNFLRTEESGV